MKIMSVRVFIDGKEVSISYDDFKKLEDIFREHTINDVDDYISNVIFTTNPSCYRITYPPYYTCY